MTFELNKCNLGTTILIMTIMITAISGNTVSEEDQWIGSLRASDVFRYSRQSEEFQENQGYVELCRTIHLRKDLLGYVNVFTFLNPTSYYSYRQAIMLELLKRRLENSGFTSIRFFVVTPSINVMEEISLEIWDEIDKNRLGSNYSMNLERMIYDEYTKMTNKSIIFLQDTPELGIWEYFRVSKDEVVVVDRCGKLAYQVIVPWSILYFPYVKAAILTTYKEDPCGPCDVKSTQYENYSKNSNTNEEKEKTNVDLYKKYTLTDINLENTTTESEIKGVDDDKTTVTSFDININISETTDSIIATTDASSFEIYSNYSKSNETDQLNKVILSETIRNYNYAEEQSTHEHTQILPIDINSEVTENYNKTQDFNINEQILTNNPDPHLSNETTDINSIDQYQPEIKDNLNSFEIEKETSKIGYNLENKNIEKANNLKNEDVLPLRIVLYAPHAHREDQTMKKYTHLVLKTGSPNYHGHFDNKNVIFHQQPHALEKSAETTSKDELIKYESDESPGPYGEITDYLKNSEEEPTDYEVVAEEDEEINANDHFNTDNSILKPTQFDIAESVMQVTINDDLEDSNQRKIIQHYNKLLTWIYYVL